MFVRRADSLAPSLRPLGFNSNSILSGHTQLKMLVQPLRSSEMDVCFSYTLNEEISDSTDETGLSYSRFNISSIVTISANPEQP